jgi:hypothetical protein
LFGALAGQLGPLLASTPLPVVVLPSAPVPVVLPSALVLEPSPPFALPSPDAAPSPDPPAVLASEPPQATRLIQATPKTAAEATKTRVASMTYLRVKSGKAPNSLWPSTTNRSNQSEDNFS